MELRDVIHTRRMVRRYDPDRPVADSVLLDCLDAATRAPSAGFSQGWDFVVLRLPQERAAFWAATTDPQAPADPWLQGISTAPVLVVACSDPDTYLDRYAEPDKGWTDRATSRWPVPYWDVDAGMASLLILLTAVDHGLGGLFFGVAPDRVAALRHTLGIPASRRIVGVIALGYAVSHPKSTSLRRGRRGLDEVAHWGRFGVAREPPYPGL
ncbi:MAG TPA: nitroreductase family protein [Candidatus Lustribacter sp.]|nr:nitroreductase family protein [Candidatus Lustribacter sp.]